MAVRSPHNTRTHSTEQHKVSWNQTYGPTVAQTACKLSCNSWCWSICFLLSCGATSVTLPFLDFVDFCRCLVLCT